MPILAENSNNLYMDLILFTHFAPLCYKAPSMSPSFFPIASGFDSGSKSANRLNQADMSCFWPCKWKRKIAFTETIYFFTFSAPMYSPQFSCSFDFLLIIHLWLEHRESDTKSVVHQGKVLRATDLLGFRFWPGRSLLLFLLSCNLLLLLR